jgi:hypothetical protein
LHFIVEWKCAVDCVLRCFWRQWVRASSTQYSLCAFVGD